MRAIGIVGYHAPLSLLLAVFAGKVVSLEIKGITSILKPSTPFLEPEIHHIKNLISHFGFSSLGPVVSAKNSAGKRSS